MMLQNSLKTLSQFFASKPVFLVQTIIRSIAVFVIIAALFTVSPAQQNADDEVIRVETQLVDVPITATSANGQPVRGLKASNFVIFEDGKRQEIADFATNAEPFEVALLLDTSGSTRNDLVLIQRAAREFVAALRPGDRVAIIAFQTVRTTTEAFSEPIILAELTDDRKKLSDAIGRVTTSNSTPYYDAMMVIGEKVFAKAPEERFRGRRAVVAMTDGVDSASAFEYEDASGALANAGAIAFFIEVDTQDFFESNLLGDCKTATKFSGAQIRRYYRTIQAKPGMERSFNFCGLGDFERLAISKRLYDLAGNEIKDLAKTTGGRVFPAADVRDARNAFKLVADEIGTKYTISYYPKNEARDGKYRKITVETTGLPKGTVVRAREGYTAPKN